VEMQEAVVDLREVSIAECMERLTWLFDRRREVRGFLEEKVPQVRAESRRFFVEHLPKALSACGVRVPEGRRSTATGGVGSKSCEHV